MKLTKYLTLILITFIISSCSKAVLIGEKKSVEATKEQQEQVKSQVVRLLEEEYKQPFKLESFSYKYDTHWQDNTCQLAICPKVIYGTYTFKIQAVDNPIIEMNFSIDDGDKDSIRNLIESFKKTQLEERYCSAFDAYYIKVTDKKAKIIQPYVDETSKFCDDRGQTGFHFPRDYYLKHESEYK